ncbi:uncharacterized protein [Lepeophtheirus salmonis]
MKNIIFWSVIEFMISLLLLDHFSICTPHETSQILKKDCFVLRFGSRRFPERFQKSSKIAASLSNCEKLCISEGEFRCRGYSFRYPKDVLELTSSPNCILTDEDLSYEDKVGLSLALLEEAYTDIYVLTRHGECNQKISNEHSEEDENPFQSLKDINSRCYKGIKNAFKHYAYRDYASVASLNQCYIRCRDSGFCKTFSFRNSRDSYSRNCLLSHRNVHEIKERDLVSTVNNGEGDSNWEVFSVESNSPLCKNYGSFYTKKTSLITSSNCFNLVGPQSKHYGSTIYGSVHAKDVASCSVLCHQDSRCRSFSFPTVTFRANLENCVLSGVIYSGKPTDFENDYNWNAFEILDVGNKLCSEKGGSHLESKYREDNQAEGRKGCFRRSKYGFSFESEYKLSVRNLNDCFDACKHHKSCQTIAFISKTNYGEPNCILNEKNILELEKDEEEIGKNFAVLYLFSLNCQENMNTDCEMILNRGFGLHDSVLKSSAELKSFEDCSDLCRRDSSCIYFSYKYNEIKFRERNCELSVYDSLGSQDFVPNSNWNVYVQLPKCRNSTKENWKQSNSTDYLDNKEHICFELTKAGYRHGVSVSNNGIYLKSLSVKDIKECRSECQRSSSGNHICLSFSYHYEKKDETSKILTIPNCILSTGSAPNGHNSWKQEDNIVPDSSWDVYNRKIEDSQCIAPFKESRDSIDSKCIDVIKTNLKHSVHRIFLSLRRADLKSCLMACLSNSNCQSFSYIPLFQISPHYSNNCLLSGLEEITLDTSDVVHENRWQVMKPRFDGVFQKCFPEKTKERKFCYRKHSHSGPLQRVSKNLKTTSFKDCLNQCRRSDSCTTFDFESAGACTLSNFNPFQNDYRAHYTDRKGRHQDHRNVYVFETCSTPKCSRLFKKRHRLYSRRPIVYKVKTMNSDSLEYCESLCLNSNSDCKYFAFRSGLIGNNCEFLTVLREEESGGGILLYDQEWNVYKVKETKKDIEIDGAQECIEDDSSSSTFSQTLNHDQQQNNLTSDKKYPLSCFDPFIRVNMDLRPRVVTKTIFVRSKEECAIECLRLQNRCSAFSYRQEQKLPYKDCKLSDLFDRNPETDLKQNSYYEIWELSSRCSIAHNHNHQTQFQNNIEYQNHYLTSHHEHQNHSSDNQQSQIYHGNQYQNSNNQQSQGHHSDQYHNSNQFQNQDNYENQYQNDDSNNHPKTQGYYGSQYQNHDSKHHPQTQGYYGSQYQNHDSKHHPQTQGYYGSQYQNHDSKHRPQTQGYYGSQYQNHDSNNHHQTQGYYPNQFQNHQSHNHQQNINPNSNVKYPFFSTYNVSSQGVIQHFQNNHTSNQKEDHVGLWRPNAPGYNHNVFHSSSHQNSSHSNTNSNNNNNVDKDHYYYSKPNQGAFNHGSYLSTLHNQRNDSYYYANNQETQNYHGNHLNGQQAYNHQHSIQNPSFSSGEYLEHPFLHHSERPQEEKHHRYEENEHQSSYSNHNIVWSVNGLICQETPQRDPVVGFWFCSTDLGGIDYVCRPDSDCSFQDGYSYP